MDRSNYYGAIEAGGTKMLCAIADQQGRWRDQIEIATGVPADTVNSIQRFFAQHPPVQSVGLASFGPIDIDPHSHHYGTLLNTSKPGWSHFPLGQALTKALNVPVNISTDVLGAALAEHRWGAAQAHQHFCYVTVGTGIGVGVYMGGRPLIGTSHPEPGHLPLNRHEDDMNFISSCPYHAHCAEGLASGPALTQRAGASLQSLQASHPIWQLAAHYLAQLCEWLNLCYQPERIVLGGGVMQFPGLLQRIRQHASEQCSGYGLPLPPEHIVLSTLDNRAGLLGALALAAPHIPLPFAYQKESP